MNESDSDLLLEEVRQMRRLLELLAEPAIAQRDAKLRTELSNIVGTSLLKQQAALLMDGVRTPTQISDQSKIDRSNLSKLIGKLEASGLLCKGTKQPKLAILIPSGFFDADTKSR